MTLRTLLWFYLGDADAIRTLAANPWSLAVGALLVVSAGLARNYDTHDVRRQWWRLLLPFVASTLAAAILVLVVMLFAGSAGTWLALGRSFLGLFWLTAPFAWIYGIPYEHLWPPEVAARRRRLALGLVALARVLLMTRCVSVLCDRNAAQAFLIVMCFAVPTALLAVGAAFALVRRPEVEATPPAAAPESPGAAAVRVVIDGMGGVALAVDARSGEVVGVADVRGADEPRPPPGTPTLEVEGEEFVGLLLGGCRMLLMLFACLTLFGLLVGPTGARMPLAPGHDDAPPSLALWAFAVIAVQFWMTAFLVRQPVQRRRTLFVERLRRGPLPETIAELTRHRPEDFPPGWDPSAALARPDEWGVGLPRVNAGRLLEACRLAASLPADSWVRRRFVERLRDVLPLWTEWFDLRVVAEDGKIGEPLRDPARLRELAELRDLLHALPERAEILEPYHDYLAALCASAEKQDPARAELIHDVYLLATKRGCRRS